MKKLQFCPNLPDGILLFSGNFFSSTSVEKNHHPFRKSRLGKYEYWWIIVCINLKPQKRPFYPQRFAVFIAHSFPIICCFPVQQQQSSRAAEQQSSRAAEQQSSRATEQQSSRAAEQQSSRAAEQQSSRAAEMSSALVLLAVRLFIRGSFLACYVPHALPDAKQLLLDEIGRHQGLPFHQYHCEVGPLASSHLSFSLDSPLHLGFRCQFFCFRSDLWLHCFLVSMWPHDKVGCVECLILGGRMGQCNTCCRVPNYKGGHTCGHFHLVRSSIP